jgi:hypothetical protein
VRQKLHSREITKKRRHYRFSFGNGSVEILFFCVIRLFSAAAGRVTPSLPQRGGRHAGSIPLPPLLLRFFINLLMIIALLGDARAAGAEARCAKNPQERLLLSLQDFNRPPGTMNNV